MSLNIEPEHDLTLIFERDDVHAAFSGHCCASHSSYQDVRQCDYCSQLRVTLAMAITEWLAIVDQERASKKGSGQF